MHPNLAVAIHAGTKNDERWQQWIAKGHAHDAQVRHRVQTIALTIAAIVAFMLAARITVQ